MSTNTKIVKIKGMTCSNCEKKIARKLRSTDGIKAVEVSLAENQAKIEYDTNTISMSEIVKIIDGLGYEAAEGQSDKRTELLNRVMIILTILIAYGLLQNSGLLNLLAPTKLADSKMSYPMLFLVGLLTSVHCVAMCGGINLSQSISANAAKSNEKAAGNMFSASILYNMGRVISYTTIGFILGGVGMIISEGIEAGVPVGFQGIVKIIAGLLMVIMGINLLGIFPWLRRIRLVLPPSIAKAITRKRIRERRPFVVGLLNGLMPCGPLQSMQIVALGTANPLMGALSMLMFSLGTVPLMLGLGSFVSLIGKKHARVVMQVGSILVVVLGLSMFTQGVNLTGIRNNVGTLVASEKEESIEETTDLASEDSSQESSQEPAQDSSQELSQDSAQEEVQYVESTLEFGTYPEITVKSNIPVVWTIDVPENVLTGCNYRMIIQKYGIAYEFAPGKNVIEFTPGEPESVQYTCWMGMINGKINIVDA